MRNDLSSTPVINRSMSGVFSENITVVRFLFYILSGIVLFRLGIQDNVLASPQGVLYTNVLLYFFIGVIAATIANSTGAGGGIVFLPIFIGLGFTSDQSLSTSIAIQCFGMTSGALTWIKYRNVELKSYQKQWKYFYYIVPVSAISSCLGLFLTQSYLPKPPLDIELLFSIFSLVIGTVILWRTIKFNHEYDGRVKNFSFYELSGLILLSMVAGSITAWLSIGIGEVLLIYLILLGFRLNVAVASAVCVSAITVLFALPHHLSANTISFDVLVYAAPGAMLGGLLARSLATKLGAHKLKIAASGWIIISAIPYLILSL